MKTKNKGHRRASYILFPIWQMIYTKLAERLPEEAMQAWVDHFELIALTKRKLVILLTADADLQTFQGKYGAVLDECVTLALDRSVRVVYKQKRTSTGRRVGLAKRLGLLVLCVLLIGAAALIAVLGGSFLINRNFRETFYQVSSGKIDENLRVIQLSDLHSTAFGGDNSRLVQRIGALAPDLIVMTGDCVEQDDSGYETTLELCTRLVEIAPVYYIYGNDENNRAYGMDMTLGAIEETLGPRKDASVFREISDPLREDLEAAGVTVLLNEAATLEVRGCQVDIYGVITSNPSAFWPYVEESYGAFVGENTENFKLLLCHEPYVFETFEDANWVDLTLCGHTHGGLIRIPYLGGIYEQSHGLLLELQSDTLIYGLYDVCGRPVIVSSGLTNRGMIRVNNQPELVVVDISRY